MLTNDIQILLERPGSELAETLFSVCERISISDLQLAKMINADPTMISKLRLGEACLEIGTEHHGLAKRIVMTHRMLDKSTAGKKATAEAWLNKKNISIEGRPIDLNLSTAELATIVAYLASILDQ